MATFDLRTSSSAGAFLVAASLLVAACGGDGADGTGSGGSGSGGETRGGETSGGETGGGDTGGGDTGGGDVDACDCADGEIEVDACPEDAPGPCVPKTCGDVTIGCIEPEPCNTAGCVTAESEGRGCANVGDECQTISCHGESGQLLVCADDHVWTDSSALYFVCGDDIDEVCVRGVEYCEDVSDAGENPVLQCKPIPDGCTEEDFCSCEGPFDVCEDASCGQYPSGGAVVTCW